MLTLLKRIYNNIFPKIISGVKEPIVGKHEDILIITYSNNKVRKYQGGCTVWYKLPYMTRCSTFKESELVQVSKYIDFYGNLYPTAHLKK